MPVARRIVLAHLCLSKRKKRESRDRGIIGVGVPCYAAKALDSVLAFLWFLYLFLLTLCFLWCIMSDMQKAAIYLTNYQFTGD